MRGMSKKKLVFFVDIPECSLSYPKIVQMRGMSKKKLVFFVDIPECSLSYPKVVQMRGMSKKKLVFFVVDYCKLPFIFYAP